jgi:hypothetical protein
LKPKLFGAPNRKEYRTAEYLDQVGLIVKHSGVREVVVSHVFGHTEESVVEYYMNVLLKDVSILWPTR